MTFGMFKPINAPEEIVHAADEDHFPVLVALCGDDDASANRITHMRDLVTCHKCEAKRERKQREHSY
jgi:hypothetical protein